jgi:hypothetical protein
MNSYIGPARLSEEDKASICAWSEEEALKVMRE